MWDFYNFIEYFFWSYGMEIIGAILAAVFGCLGYAAKKIYQNHVNDETKQTVARLVVQFVEQAWKSLHGKDKLAKALETAEILLRKKNIPFDAEEMMVRIEAAVAEFNEVFKAPLVDENAKATYRIDNDTPAAVDPQ